MYLATVTCNRDFQQLLLQAESIQKFLKPCKHVIIINEPNPDIEFYHRWLDRYYTNHELVLLPRLPYNYPLDEHGRNQGSGNGWRIQQLQKLLLAYEYDEDYVLIDTKNFFIKAASLDYYENPNFYGSGFTSGYEDGQFSKFHGNYKIYCKLLGMSELPKYGTTNGTPYKIHRNLLTNRISKESLGYYLFAPEYNKSTTSEFTLYSLVISEYVDKFRFDDAESAPCVFWPWDPHVDHIDNYLHKANVSKTFIMGFHRDFLNLTGPDHIAKINSWLQLVIGLRNKVIPYTRDHTMSNYTI